MYRLLIFFALFFSISPVHSEPSLHICTVASFQRVELYKLMYSCHKNHLELDILGYGLPYPSNGIKFIYMLDYLKKFDDQDVVMFVDAFDVLILEEKEVILEKFKKFKAPIIMSVEKNCFPYSDLAHDFPVSPTPFRFINTGTYIGYVGELKKWLMDLNPNPHWDDQAQAMLHYLKNKGKFLTFDYHCELFLPLVFVNEEDVIIDSESKSLYCMLTGSHPSVIHANGYSFGIWNKAWDAFYIK